MKRPSDITPAQLKVIHKLEKIALELDQGCRDGQIETKKIDAAQTYINKVASELPISEFPDKWVYIIHEVQALIHWIQGDESEASSLLRSAYRISGNTELFTVTARKLLEKDQPHTAGKKGSRNLTGKELLLVVLVCYLINIIIGGIIGALFGTVGALSLLFALAHGITKLVKRIN